MEDFNIWIDKLFRGQCICWVIGGLAWHRGDPCTCGWEDTKQALRTRIEAERRDAIKTGVVNMRKSTTRCPECKCYGYHSISCKVTRSAR